MIPAPRWENELHKGPHTSWTREGRLLARRGHLTATGDITRGRVTARARVLVVPGMGET